MADIRSYTREKEKRERQTGTGQSRLKLVKAEDEDTFREKLHRHRMSFVYRALLMLLICGALAALVVVQYHNKVYTDYEVLSEQKLSIASGNTAQRLGSHVLVYSKDGAWCADAAGNVLWNQTYEMQSPIVALCGSTVAIGDYNGRTIYIQNAEKQLGTVSTNLPIRNLSVAANGVVAAVLEDSSVTWIYVYDTSGNELVKFRTSMKNTGYPVSVCLSPDALLCMVSYVYVDAGEMKSSVAFYNFDEYGKNMIDNLVGGYDYADTLIPYVRFTRNGSAFAVGDDSIMFYGGSQKPELLSRYFFETEIRGVYYSESYTGVVFYNASGEKKYRLEIYDGKGERVSTQEFDLDYTDILFDGNTCIIYNETNCLVRTVAGAEKYNGALKEGVNLLIPGSGSYRYVLVTQDSLDTIQMK